jgi:hypothetical protein
VIGGWIQVIEEKVRVNPFESRIEWGTAAGGPAYAGEPAAMSAAAPSTAPITLTRRTLIFNTAGISK